MYRVLQIGLAVTIVTILALIAAPKFLSSSFIKQQIEAQLSEMLGRSVFLNGNSSVSIRPYLGVSYRDVTVLQADGNPDTPLVSVEGLRAKLGLFSAFWGNPQIVKLQLVRPRFNLRIDKDGVPNWRLEKGPLAERLSLPEAKQPKPFPLGTVQIEDGIVDISDETEGSESKLTALNGVISWDDIQSAGAATLDGVWRGEVVKLRASAASPFEILRGGSSSVELSIDSNPLVMDFNGTVDTADVPFAKGVLGASTPSPGRLAEWFGQNIPATLLLPDVSIGGDVTATAFRLDLPDAKVEIGQNDGVGQLQLVLDDTEQLSVNGTIAFESLALPDIRELGITRSKEMPNAAQPQALNLEFLRGLNVDLQVSAESAQSGPVQIESLAASAVINSGKASFDVGQAQTMGGALTGSVSLEVERNITQIAADLELKDIELAQLATLYGENSVSLDGQGSAALNLKSSGNDAKALMRSLKGSATVEGADGVLKGINLASIADPNSEDADDFNANIFDGETGFSELRMALMISNGIAYLQDTTMTASGFKAFLSGRTDIPKRSLALSGRIVRPLDASEEVETLQFFVGGTTVSPLLVPLSTTRRSQAAPDDAPTLSEENANN